MDVLYALLEEGADVDAQDVYGNTSLHLAASYGDMAVVRQLLRARATNYLTNSNGNTALQEAAVEGHTDVVRLLQQLQTRRGLRRQ